MRECDNLLNEIERLHKELSTQERRLKNVMDLVSHIISSLFAESIWVLAIGVQ